jgi:DNA (cytosine-5)-methyltransferase 1
MTDETFFFPPGYTRIRTQELFREEAWMRSASGLLIPVPSRAELAHSKLSAPIGVSLFTGAGGFDLGLQRAGFHVLAASDAAPECAWTYGFNMGTRPMQFHFLAPENRADFMKRVVKPSRGKVSIDHVNRVLFRRDDSGPAEIEHATPHFFLGDVRKLHGQQVLDAISKRPGEVDCVFGGPPCQGFSRAGRRNVMDPRNSLVFEFARLVLEIRPKAMVMENVPDIVSMITPEGIPVVDAFCKILANGNYASYESLRRTLTSHPASRALLQGQGRGRKETKQGTQDEERDQLSLFGEEL